MKSPYEVCADYGRWRTKVLPAFIPGDDPVGRYQVWIPRALRGLDEYCGRPR